MHKNTPLGDGVSKGLFRSAEELTDSTKPNVDLVTRVSKG